MKVSESFETISTIEMAIADRNSEFLGVPRRILMENAGRSVAEVVYSKFKELNNVLVVAGLGDNGGDGLVAARYLYNWGKNVKVILLGREEDIRSDLTRENYRVLKNLIGVELLELSTPYELLTHEELFTKWAQVIVDAIIGTGIRGMLREPQLTAIELINLSKAK